MFYFPKKATKREQEIALKLEAVDRLPERDDLWKPLHWRMMNFLYASFCTAILCVLILEFSYSNYYLQNQYTCLLLLFMFSKGFNLVLYHQLQDVILCMPAASALAFFTQVHRRYPLFLHYTSLT